MIVERTTVGVLCVSIIAQLRGVAGSRSVLLKMSEHASSVRGGSTVVPAVALLLGAPTCVAILQARLAPGQHIAPALCAAAFPRLSRAGVVVDGLSLTAAHARDTLTSCEHRVGREQKRATQNQFGSPAAPHRFDSL